MARSRCRAARALLAAVFVSSCSGDAILGNPCGINNSCNGGGGGGGNGSVASIAISPTPPSTLVVGGNLPLHAVAVDAQGTPVAGVVVSFSSSSPNVATVDVAGLIHGVSPGQVTITASAAGKSAQVLLTILPWTLATVDAGGDFSCGLTATGDGYCWGRGHFLGTTSDSTCFDDQGPPDRCSLVPVHFATNLTFATISTGGTFACGVTPISQGFCWGRDDVGQLGDGQAGNDSVPVRVVGGLAFTSISTGLAHACAIIPSGAAYCWGLDDLGQLGFSRRLNSTTPIPVDGGLLYSAISAGDHHSCGIQQSTHAAWCWGDNSSGQLGTTSVAQSDVPVPVSGGLAFQTITAGGDFTCGLTIGGVLYCWGNNSKGQLGLGSFAGGSSVPVAVTGGVNFSSIDAGSETACGLDGSGHAYCWGDNSYGQVGDSTQINRGVPTLVVGGLTFTSVVTGHRHSCGVASTGITYCWGSDVLGALGDQLQALSLPSPQQVASPR